MVSTQKLHKESYYNKYPTKLAMEKKQAKKKKNTHATIFSKLKESIQSRPIFVLIDSIP